MSLASAFQALVEPIPAEKQHLLGQRWADLHEDVRTPGQGFGRQATGCGATVGIMPRCDFDCRGCYLGEDANSMHRKPLREALEQLDQIREFLGPNGNLQVTDGEVTLLPQSDLLAILRHARDIGLIPMVMTHGETFRRKPDLLPRLVSEGGLTEVSIHVDCLQTGRRDDYAHATSEAELMPLRQEFADMILAVRRQTGVRLRAATTLTCSHSNLAEVPDVVRWALENCDAFGMLSIQTLAQVGRTRDDERPVSSREAWSAIGEALEPFGFDAAVRTPLLFGHPECTRMEPFAVYRKKCSAPLLAPIVRPHHARDLEIVEGYFRMGLGGVVFRDDPLPTRILRGLGLFLKAPGWFLGPARRWLLERVRDLGTSVRGLALGALTRRGSLGSFVVVTHHFMDSEEVETPEGRARLDACVFRVPVGSEMRSMCAVNAGGLRDAVYRGDTDALYSIGGGQDEGAARAAATNVPSETART